jgi:GNAT superfamily N-acetyltransferase
MQPWTHLLFLQVAWIIAWNSQETPSMKLRIRPFEDEDIAELVQLSLLAWEPVFRSFRQVLGGNIYSLLYPDWKAGQRRTVESVCKDREKYTTWVAEVDGAVVGFISYEMDPKEKTGEVVLLAVLPVHQNRGIGTELSNFALNQLREMGMKLAIVGTGGDEGHAAARRTYEKAGYTGLPLVRYYKDLTAP